MPIKEKDFKYLNRGGVVHKDGTPAAKDQANETFYGSQIGYAPVAPSPYSYSDVVTPIVPEGEPAPSTPTVPETTYGDSNDTGNATTTVTPTTKIPTLSEYLASQVDAITGAYETTIANIDARNKQAIADNEEIRKKAVTYAEEQKLAAEEAAGIQRQRDMIDAANAYERNKATYGAKAEALADMGLTGGGYSDYLDAQAYATQRGDVQAAIGRETESRRLAANAYNDAVNKALYDEAVANQTANISAGEQKSAAEISKNTAVQAANDAAASYNEGIFTNILDKISTGAISADQIESLASLYGMSEEQKKAWLDAANKYSGETVANEETAYKSISAENVTNITSDIKSGSYYTAEDLERMVTNKQLTPEDKAYIEQYQEKAVNDTIDYYTRLGDVQSLVSYVEEMYARKTISEDKRQKIYYNATLQNVKNVETKEEYDIVLKDIDDLLKEEKLAEADADSLKQYLKSILGQLK